MDTDKVIRTIGYVVYVILWSPVIAAILLLITLVAVICGICCGTVSGISGLYKATIEGIKNSARHDMGFIRNGKW